MKKPVRKNKWTKKQAVKRAKLCARLRAHNRKGRIYKNLVKALDDYIPYTLENPPTPDKITLAVICKQLQCCLKELG